MSFLPVVRGRGRFYSDVMTTIDFIAPVVIAGIFVAVAGLLPEPARRRYMAVFVGGAGAAYLNGGFGGLEFPFVLAASYVAYRGLDSYRFIGIAWLMHTGWDIAHHFYGNPIIHAEPTSSAGCAITDALLAVWFFAGAPRLVGPQQRAHGVGTVEVEERAEMLPR